jgi:hypothetical protein
MKRIAIILLLALMLVFGLWLQANAILVVKGTDALGNQLIYDSDFNITWYDYTYTSDIGTWQGALDWADALTVSFGGITYDNWRLPTALNRDGTGPCVGYDCIESEMGHLYYTELENPYDAGSEMNTSFIDGLTGLEESFSNLMPTYMYWLAEPYSDTDAWLFSFDYGVQSRTTKEGWLVAIAVFPGEVFAVDAFTPPGENVTVEPQDSTTGESPVTITFDEVTDSGITNLTTSETGQPPPSSFKVGASPVYYEVTTTAEYSGGIRVCITYDPANFSVPEENLKIMHWEDSDGDGNYNWEDVTCEEPPPNPDIVAHQICACVTSLSTFAIFEPIMETSVQIDIKPTSCPNKLNVQEKGVLPVAVLGTVDFDSTHVDPAAVLLEGVSPLRWTLEDVATPYNGAAKSNCLDCTEEGPDGEIDLVLMFDMQEVVYALGGVELEDGQVLVLSLTGKFYEEFSGTPIRGEDIVTILKKGMDQPK